MKTPEPGTSECDNMGDRAASVMAGLDDSVGRLTELLKTAPESDFRASVDARIRNLVMAMFLFFGIGAGVSVALMFHVVSDYTHFTKLAERVTAIEQVTPRKCTAP